jgi:hypothetical protein
MKVFDFTNGTKGDLLGDITICNSTGGWFVEKNGSTFKVELADPKNVDPVAGGKAGIKWTWHTGATNFMESKDHAIKAEDFGVGAICFCAGEFAVLWHIGHPEAETQWEWSVIGTTEWNREACKSGILKAIKQA